MSRQPGGRRWPEPPAVHGDVCLVPLTRELAVLDTVAYLSSPRAIGSHSAGRWPMDGFTLEQNLALIAHHEAEHRAGDAFAYAILDPRGDQEWGCVYLRPLAPYLERTATCLALPEATVRSAAIATFWLIDDGSRRPAATEVLPVVEGWTAAWSAAPVVFRCLPEESESLSALEGSGLDRVDASTQPLPYLWFLRDRGRRGNPDSEPGQG